MPANKVRSPMNNTVSGLFNPAATLSVATIAPHQSACVVDDACLHPEYFREVAANHATLFRHSDRNAYPGGEVPLPASIRSGLEQFFNLRIRQHFAVRRLLTMDCRLAMVTLQPAELAPRQWICHRDRFHGASDSMVVASVLYLFDDPLLGGTNFFTAKHSEEQTMQLINDSGRLSAVEFSSQYGVAGGYQTGSNSWFEKTATIAPKFNRMIFYEGSSVFHCSDIPAPERLSQDPRTGRLTLNGFFVCRRAAAGGTAMS